MSWIQTNAKMERKRQLVAELVSIKLDTFEEES